jgi:hypothetical protein
MRSNPFGGLHPLDLLLALNGGTPGTVWLGPNEIPWPVFSREMAFKAIGSIVILYSLGEVRGLTDVKLAAWIFQHVNPKHRIGSVDKIRTYKSRAIGINSQGFSGRSSPLVNWVK